MTNGTTKSLIASSNSKMVRSSPMLPGRQLPRRWPCHLRPASTSAGKLLHKASRRPTRHNRRTQSMDEITKDLTAFRSTTEEAMACRHLHTGTHTGIQDTCIDLTTGIGTSMAQHGEILQGQLEDSDYQWRRFLLSLPCDLLYSRATFTA